MNHTYAAVVQARMGSTRLPGKVLLPLNDVPVLGHVISRVKKARSLSHVIVATSTSTGDDSIANWCRDNNVGVFRGSEENVLERYVHAVESLPVSAVVRITGDCPAIDGDVIDRVVKLFEGTGADYASNIRPRSFPHGLDVEIVKREALSLALREAKEQFEREHVTPFIWRQPKRFRCVNLKAPPCDTMPDLRITLDTQSDYLLIKVVFDMLGACFSVSELVNLVQRHPWIKEINRDVMQKPVFVEEDPNVRRLQEILYAARYCLRQELHLAAYSLAQLGLGYLGEKGGFLSTIGKNEAEDAICSFAERLDSEVSGD